MNELNIPKNYVLVKGPDGISWLSLEPCISDLNHMLQDETFKTAHYNIEIVKVFLESMVQELKIQEWEKAKANKEDNDELSYKETLH